MSNPTARMLELALAIQQIPAPTFEERQRSRYVKERFQAHGLEDVSTDPLDNVYARLPGSGGGKPLVVSAHLDTVFPADTPLQASRDGERISGPGIGDNSLGVAALFGLVWRLRAMGIALPGDLWLVANVCEEGLGDLRGMRAVVERFGDRALAYLVIEGMALGYVQCRGLGVHRFRIHARTSGGHSWSDYGLPSATHEIAKLVADLAGLDLPSEPRTTLNAGRMAGGTSVNSIAAEAWCELDLRSESLDALRRLVRKVEHLVDSCNLPGVRMEAETIGVRPPGELPPNHPLVELAQECLRDQGIEPRLTIGSTDANIPLSKGLPALVLGVTTGGGAHTAGEYIHVEPVERGMNHLLAFLSAAWTRPLGT